MKNDVSAIIAFVYVAKWAAKALAVTSIPSTPELRKYLNIVNCSGVSDRLPWALVKVG